MSERHLTFIAGFLLLAVVFAGCIGGLDPSSDDPTGDDGSSDDDGWTPPGAAEALMPQT